MALSVLASVVPLLFLGCRRCVYFAAVVLGCLSMYLTYQASSGIFVLVCAFVLFKRWSEGEKFKSVLRDAFWSACGFLGASCIFLIIGTFRQATTYSSAHDKIASLVDLPLTIYENSLRYLKLIYSDFPRLWLIMIGALAIGCVCCFVLNAKRNKILIALLALIMLALCSVGSYGAYLALENPIFQPRAMLGFGVFIALTGIIAVSGRHKITYLFRAAALCLAWCFFVFALTYGNALAEQKRYVDFRAQIALADLSRTVNLEDVSKGLYELQLSGEAPVARMVNNMSRRYKVLERLVPKYLVVNWVWGPVYLSNYFGMPKVRFVAKYQDDFSKYNLPVVYDNCYHTIRADDGRISLHFKYPENSPFPRFTKREVTFARIDIKNSGSEANDVEVLEISDADAKVDSPKWMRGNGMGHMITARKGTLALKLKCRGDGTLSTILRGADARDSSNKRIPVWVRYSKLVVDGKVLFDEVRATCHDKPQKFTMNVKDGQVVDVLIEWDPEDITIGDIAEEVQERKDAPKAPKPTQASKTIDLNLVSYARVDIKNAGTEKNDVEVARVSDAKAIVESPKWMRAKDGNGRMIKTDSGTLTLKLKCTGDGDLTINLRGADFRGADGKRVPVWINYKKLTVDGKVIFSAVKPTWHDRPQKFTMKVKDGQTVDVKVEWVPDCVTVGRGMDQVVKSNEKVAQKQSEQIKSLKSDLKKANAEKTRFAAKLKKLSATNRKLQSQLKEIRSGWWYKVFHRLKLVG